MNDKKRHNQPNYRLSPRAVSTLVASMVALVAVQASQPKLVVGIVVDGLRQEVLDMLQPHLEKDGFNRFLQQGAVFDNVDFGTNLDVVAATAMVATGASPNVNGISAERVYDSHAKRTNHIFSDDEALGNFAQEALSPKALKVTTISDEARIAGAGVSYVYAIAPNAAQSLVLASHAGNSAVWFNDKTGNWASSTYYGDMPLPAVNSNRVRSLSHRLDTMQWSPASSTAIASPLPDHLTRYPFHHTFAKNDKDRYVRFAESPLMNSEVTRLANEYINTLELGRHDGTDVLNLAFSLQPYQWTKTAENRYEQYDSYIKLDRSLAQLFSTIDKAVGRENAVIYLACTPARSQRRKDDSKWNVPGGEFSSRKAISLLNLYLIAMHGNGEWVTAFNDGHFYLNEDLAKQREKDISLLRRQATEFLVRMSGVGHAYTIDEIVSADVSVQNAEGQARNTVIAHSGDVVIDLLPGWSLVDDYNIVGHSPNTTYAIVPTTASFMITAPGVKSQRIDTPVDARAIAPALAGMLHIRSPNGASTSAITLR